MSVSQNFPNIAPSMSMDFANVKKLDPRVTFARASEGRYYDGVTTAKAEENLFSQSQALATSPWSAFSVVRTNDADVAPDGTTTATRLELSGSGAGVYQAVSPNTATDIMISAWVKRNGAVDQTFRLFVRGNVRSSDFTATSTWQRFTFTTSSTGSGTNAGITQDTLNSASDILVWGAQLEQRSSVTAYTPTTTQPITNYIPVLQTASANVARFDHDPVTGESLGLLVEEQRTNLLTYSSEFDNAAWTKTNSSVTADTIVAPDGTLTADLLTENTAATTQHVVNRNEVTTAAPYTLSVYAKLASGNRLVYLRIRDNLDSGTTYGLATFTLSGSGTAAADTGTAAIQNVGDGWYRCSITGTTPAASVVFMLGMAAGGAAFYTGDGTSGIYIWGAQVEAGAFPTSYIPTVASQVTRSADAASMTGTNFSEWFSNAEGTLYAEFMRQGTNTSGQEWRIFALGDIDLSVVTNQTRFKAFGDSNVNLYPGDYSADVYSKIAGAYKVNDFAASLNGGTVVADTVGTLGTVTAAYIGNRPTGGRNLNGHIKKLSYYPLRLSNANLQALTGS